MLFSFFAVSLYIMVVEIGRPYLDTYIYVGNFCYAVHFYVPIIYVLLIYWILVDIDGNHTFITTKWTTVHYLLCDVFDWFGSLSILLDNISEMYIMIYKNQRKVNKYKINFKLTCSYKITLHSLTGDSILLKGFL